jgi:Tol biopolymer transport system component
VHTPLGYSDTDPTVSWAGDRVAVRRRNGNNDLGIVILDLDANPLFYTSYPGHGQMPAWSRNDSFMAFVSSPNLQGATDVYVTQVGSAWRKHITVGAAIGGGRNPVFVRR